MFYKKEVFFPYQSSIYSSSTIYYKFQSQPKQMSSKTNYKVYMDVQIGASGAGRIVFQLFNDLTPKTSQNFRGLCTGEYGKANNTKLHYLNTKFHRIIDGFVIQGGDVSNTGGKGGFSIYGRTFIDENFSRTHSCAGLLSMANCGRNTNSSQFFITLKACPHLDGKHVVFGQVIDGMEVVRKISKVPIDKQDKPRIPIMIVDCGQVGDYKAFLKYDPFKKQVYEQIRARKQKIIKDQYMIRKLLAEGMDTNQAYQYKKKLQKCERDLMDLNKQELVLEAQKQEEKNKKHQNQHLQQQQDHDDNEKVEKSPVITQQMREKFGQKNINKFLDLKLKLNQAKVLNSRAALQEEIRQNDTNYHKMTKKRQWLQKKKHQQEQIESKGIGKDKFYLNRNALKKDDDDGEKEKQQSYGWNVYTDEAYYGAYEKRCQVLTKNQDLNKEREKQEQQQPIYNSKPSQQALNRLQADIVKQQQKRSVFSRKRMHDEEETVNYINQKNRVYNQKLQRNFRTYSSAIRTSLQMNSQKQ